MNIQNYAAFKELENAAIRPILCRAVSSKMYNLSCAPIEDSDQPAHPYSLIIVSELALWVAKGPTFLETEN